MFNALPVLLGMIGGVFLCECIGEHRWARAFDRAWFMAIAVFMVSALYTVTR